jgi:hypothetical protein
MLRTDSAVTPVQTAGPGACRGHDLAWVKSALYEAELAVHNGDAAPRRALWSRNEPVSILGAWRNAYGQHELDEALSAIAIPDSPTRPATFNLRRRLG